MSNQNTTAFEGWALVEQMGFRRTVGKVCEIEQYGTKMLRLDVPFFDDGAKEPSGYTTIFAGGPSIYQVSPLDEELALHMARSQSDPRPVRPMAFRVEDKRDPHEAALNEERETYREGSGGEDE